MMRSLLSILFSGSMAAAAWSEVIIRDQVTGVASYISDSQYEARETEAAAAIYYLKRYRRELGIDDVESDLRLIRSFSTSASTRYSFQQLREGRRVFGAIVGVTLRRDKRSLLAISSAYNPLANEIQPDVQISARDAVAIAKTILPSATEARARELVLLQPVATRPDLKFVWLVDLEDPQVGTFMTYAIDAVDGFVEDSIALQQPLRDRITRDAQTNQSRNETGKATGNVAIDGVHGATGVAHDYFYKSLGFDSFDGAGATIQSLVNDPASVGNAYYKHQIKTLLFGPGLVALDVTVHEFTHGVIKHTAGLKYKGQSGALNESYADVFGVIVDAEDWLLGEDLPAAFRAGRPALRDVKNPKAFDQPDKVEDYELSCGIDHDGVHTNSGIPNRGFYEVASRIGREDAGEVYFQALALLTPWATFQAHRRATLDATRALFPGDEQKLQLVDEGLAAAGLVAGMNIAVCPTSACPVASAADELQGIERREFAINMAAAYRLRDEVLRRHAVIGSYALEKYAGFSGDLATTVFTNPSMALDIMSFIRTITPVVNRVGDGELDQHEVTDELIQATEGIIERIVGAFQQAGKGDAAEALERLSGRFDLGELAGKTYAEAMDIIRRQISEAREGEDSGQDQGGEKDDSGRGGQNQPEPEAGNYAGQQGGDPGERQPPQTERIEGSGPPSEERIEADQQPGERAEKNAPSPPLPGRGSGEEEAPVPGGGSSEESTPAPGGGSGEGNTSAPLSPDEPEPPSAGQQPPRNPTDPPDVEPDPVQAPPKKPNCC